MKFTETSTGIWKSDITAVSAMMLAGENREPKAIHEPRFIIKQGEDKKNNTVYRLYEQHVGRKEFIKRFKTLEAAVKAANKELEA